MSSILESVKIDGCKFCGCKAEIHSNFIYKEKNAHVKLIRLIYYVSLQCTNCSERMSKSVTPDTNNLLESLLTVFEELVTMWNTRIDDMDLPTDEK